MSGVADDQLAHFFESCLRWQQPGRYRLRAAQES